MKKPKLTQREWSLLYFQRLGEFIHTFSAMEREMQALLWYFAGVSRRTGKAIFSGIKADGAAKFIKKLIQNRGANVRADLTYVFDQLKIINDARNLMLHQQVKNVRKSHIVISNAKTVFSKDAVKQVVVSPDILRKMTNDLQKIRTHIQAYTYPETPAFKMYSALPLAASWQYKLPSERSRKGNPKKRSNQKKGQKHPNPPQSSPG